MRLAEIKSRVQPTLRQDFDAVYEEYVLETGHGRLRPFVHHLLAWKLVDESLANSLLADAPDAEPAPPSPEVTDDDEGSFPPAPPPVPAELSKTTMTPIAVERDIAPPAVVRAPPPETDQPFGEDDRDATVTRDPSNGVDLAAETVQLPTREAMEAVEAEMERRELAQRATVERPGLPRPAVPTVELNPTEDSAEWEDVPEADDDAPKRTMFRKLSGGALEEMSRFGETPEVAPRRRRRRRVPAQNSSRYAFEGTVGEGAMGRVLLARDGVLHRSVAYKAMSEDLLEQPALASKFGAEARITAQLDHPNVVPVYELESDTSYTMKLIEGRTLQDILDEIRSQVDAGKPVPEEFDLDQRLEWFGRVCEAVAYANSRGVIHRDLKPENVMVGQWGEVYVMDWGIAKVVDRTVPHPVDVPEEEDEGELIIGTAGYMSPEQAEGWNDDLTAASDQYALGLILFELISLNPAVTGKAPLKLVMRHQDGEKDPLVHRAKQRLPKELVAIVHKATSKSTSSRYASVAELGDDVRRHLRGDPVRARPDGPVGALIRWMGKHRELTFMVGLAVGLGSLILITAIVGYSQVRVARAQAAEQRVTTLITDAAKQGSLIDGQFLKVEGLLSVVSTAAAEALQRAADGPEPLYTPADFDGPTPPPDAEPPNRGFDKYGTGPVSTTVPVLLPSGPIDEDEEENRLRERLERLSGLGRHFQRVLLRSHSEKRAAINRSLARRTIVEVDIPVSWAFVALDDGSLFSFPGHGGWPDDVAPLDSPWYGAAQSEQAPVWGRVNAHPVTQAPVLTVSQAVLDVSDATVGVAGLHLSLPQLQELLIPPGLSDASSVRGLVLDGEGRVVLDSSVAPDAQAPTRLNEPFPVEPVRLAAEQHRSGTYRQGSELFVFSQLTSNRWTYVLQGPEDALLIR